MTNDDQQMLAPALMAAIKTAQQAAGCGDTLRAALADALRLAERERFP